MSTDPVPRIGLPPKRAVLKQFERASRTFDNADAVHAEARRRMLARLQLFKLTPECVVDLGAATGKASRRLSALYPQAQICAVDLSLSMVMRAHQHCVRLDRVTSVVGDAEQLPIMGNSVDLVFANLLLPWCDPQAVFSEAARILRDGGLLLFTTVGPDTLLEIRRAWSEVDDTVHVHGFIDMHDLGDLAGRAGLVEPVMDVDRLQVTYGELSRLVEDLRGCGATNVAHGRRTQLTAKGRWRGFCDRLEARRTEGSLAMSVELIFGQAWGAGGSTTMGDGAVRISVDELTQSLRDRRGSRG